MGGRKNGANLRVEFTAEEADAGTRLDVFLAGRLADRGISRSKIQSRIKAGQVQVDNESVLSPKFKLDPGSQVCFESEEAEPGVRAVAGDVKIVFRDECLLVVDKAAGLTVHPAPGETGPTLVNHLVHEIPELAALDPERPGIVHRIDKDTSGLMVVALDDKTRLDMARMFAERKVDKAYLAICFGSPKPSRGRLDAEIARDPSNRTRMTAVKSGGREALSEYETLWTAPDGGFSLLKVAIKTGRTHQIRVHLADAGHPLAGDRVYGPRENAEMERQRGVDVPGRQMLHAWRLGFSHPGTGRAMRFGSRPPQDFMEFLFELARRPLRIGVVGSPGSGKSVLAGLLKELDVEVFSADACVAELYKAGADGAGLIAGRFGGRFNDPSGAVDKKGLFRAMQEDDAVRREVIDLIHPLVKHRLREFWREHSSEPLLAAEIPLLLEAGWQDRELVDLIVCVTAPDFLRAERLAKARGWDEETAARMESWQWPQDKKAAGSDIVMDNSGDLKDLGRRVAGLHVSLLAEARERNEARRAELEELTDPG